MPKDNHNELLLVGLSPFNLALNSQFGWRRRAERLFRAASVLLAECWRATLNRDKLLKKRGPSTAPSLEEYEAAEGSFLYEEASLLVALAIENLFKALWIGKNYDTIQEVARLPKSLHDHDLEKLARQAGIPVTASERKALRVLTQFGVWRGKYTLPTDDRKLGQAMFDGAEIKFVMRKYPGSPGWPDEILSLLQKTTKELDRIPDNKRC